MCLLSPDDNDDAYAQNAHTGSCPVPRLGAVPIMILTPLLSAVPVPVPFRVISQVPFTADLNAAGNPFAVLLGVS